MTQITQDNFDIEYQDLIEVERIDKFVSDEMERQIHRYIKAYHGSKDIMDKFIQRLKGMSVEQKEEAIAAYIDINRKAVSGLDLQIVLARAMANYCDTFLYFKTMLNDKKKFDFYLKRIKEKYTRLHEVFEQDGLFGIKNYKGDILVHGLLEKLVLRVLEHQSHPEPGLPGQLFVRPDVLPVQNHAAGGGLQKTVELLHQGGFSGAGVADDADKFPPMDAEGHVLQSLVLKGRANAVDIV